MTATLMETLKKSTAAMHDSAEGSPFQSLLTKAKLPKEVYADYLAQLYLLHGALEQELRRHASTAAVVSPAEFQEEFLKQDLTSLGRRPEDSKPLSSTSKLLADIEVCSKECPEALLGMHYVLLGSKHGGKFIAKNMQSAYGLQDGLGSVYFDPYGPTFMSIWKQFKEQMNQLDVSPAVTEAISTAAGQMFNRITEIGLELMPRVTSASA